MSGHTEQQLSVALRPNPFPGLRPFRSDEHHLFFGREEQTAALLQLLRQNRFLAVVGTSGSGKSSLVRAGMMAGLYGGTMTQAGSTWEVVILRPGGSPIENLARALVEADLYDPDDPSTLPRLLATLNRSRYGLVEAVKQSDCFEPGTNLLVVVDQFEELFRFRQQGISSEEAAAAFVNLLLTASRQAECPIYVTITMRSDYLGDCSEIPGLAEAVNEGEYLIPRLLRDQKRDAIEKPIGVGGAKISPLLVQRLLNDVGDDPDQLPVLQHALMRMWDVWSASQRDSSDGDTSRPIDFCDFEAIGGLDAAMSHHADEIYESLSDEEHRRACERIFKTLTEKGADNRGIRRPTRLPQLTAIAGADRATVTKVLDAFRQPGVTFLMPGLDSDLEDQTVIDLSHESLMRGWRRLRGWVEDEAQSACIFRRLLDTAWLWREGRAGLFRDPDLQIALSWRQEEHPNEQWAEQYGGQFETAIAFLDQSQQAAEAEIQAKEAARQRELEQARQLAEARKQRLEQQQRAAKKLRAMIAGLAVVAAIAGVACVAAMSLYNKADRLADLAQQEADNANRSADEANREREAVKREQQKTQAALTEVEKQKEKVDGLLQKSLVAEDKAVKAEQRSREFRYATDIQLAGRLIEDKNASASQVLSLLADHDPVRNPELQEKGDLRGFEAHYLSRLVESQAAVFPAGDETVVAAVATPEGELITLDDQAQLRRFNLSTHEETRPVLDLGKDRKLVIKALSPDGKLAALAVGNQVVLVDTKTGEETGPAIRTSAQFGLIFTPDNKRLVTIGANIGWWDIATGKPIAVQVSEITNVSAEQQGRLVSISADGKTVAVGGINVTYLSSSFSVFRLNEEAREVQLLLSKHTPNFGSIRMVALSPDGTKLAASQYFSGAVKLFDAQSGRELKANSTEHSASVSAIGFNPAGSEMVTASLDGVVKVWDDYETLEAATKTFIGHTGEVSLTVFTADGKRLLSAGKDKTVRLWDLSRRGTSLHRTVADNEVYRAAFSPDGLLLATSGGSAPTGLGNSRISIRDAVTGKVVRDLIRVPTGLDPTSAGSTRLSPDSVAFSPDNRRLAAGFGGAANQSYIELWDIDAEPDTPPVVLPAATAIPGFNVSANTGIVSALAFSPDGRFLVAGFGSLNALPTGDIGNFPVQVIDVAARRTVRLLQGHRNYCVSVAFSNDGTRLASASYDGTVRIWDTASWKSLFVLDNPDSYTDLGRRRMWDVAFSPDGAFLATASHEGNVHVFDAVTGDLLRTLKGHTNGVLSVAFSPDGKTLASGSGDTTVRLWNVATWRELMRLDSGDHMANERSGFTPKGLVFSPDGRQLVGAGGEALSWSTRSLDGSPPDQLAEQLVTLLKSKADFKSRIRMLSDNLRLHEALAMVAQNRPEDARIQAALAATRANWHASRKEWQAAVAELDKLKQLGPANPEGWLRTGARLRLAQACIELDRPAEAVVLLADAERQRERDGMALAREQVHVGFIYTVDQATVTVTELLKSLHQTPPVPLSPGDVILKVNDTELTADTVSKLDELLKGDAGTQLRLTVRRAAGGKQEEVEITKASYLIDSATADLLLALSAVVDERLEEDPANPTLHELRAELALHWQGNEEAVADYTAAIEALSELPKGEGAADIARLYRRRGNAYVDLKQWQQARDDFAQGVTEQTTEEDLLANQALALAEPLLQAKVLVSTSETEGTVWRYLASDTSDAPPDWTDPEFDDSAWQEAPGGFGGPTGAGVPFTRTSWTTNHIWLRHSFKWSGDQTLKGLALRIFHDDHLDVYLNGQQIADIKSYRSDYGWHQLDGKAVAALRDGTNVLAVHCRQFAGAQFVDVGLYDATLSGWWDHSKTADPWQKLATVYRINDDQTAIDQLVARRPQVAGSVGDLFIQGEDKDWQRAVEIYSRGINAESPHADLLAKRARAYEQLGTWDAAAADWEQAAKVKPNGAQLLTEFARRLSDAEQMAQAAAQRAAVQQQLEAVLQDDPTDVLAIHDLATVLADMRLPTWSSLKSPKTKSQGGATMELLKDGSILVSGVNPDKEVYEIEAEINQTAVTAIRLEVLTHDSLPGQGHSRSGNRNALLTEFEAEIAAPGEPPVWTPVKFAQAWADHAQGKNTIAKAIDGNQATYWETGGYRLVEDRTAVFIPETPFGFGPGTRLLIRLRHESQYAKQGFGRFRLSVTTTPEPLQKTEFANSVKNTIDPPHMLAAAYSFNGETAASAAWFGRALDQAETTKQREVVLKELQSHSAAAAALFRQRPENRYLQLAFARSHVVEGQKKLAREKPAEALADFQKARDLFSRLLNENPEPGWTVLRPSEMISAGGATLTLQDDGSILASGENPDQDTYTLVAKSGLPRITAFRLEALPDPSLPKNGPGRYEGNGNFHLNELRVTAGGVPVKLTDIVGSYDESDQIDRVIDGQISPVRGWSIHPQAGQANTAWITTEWSVSQRDSIQPDAPLKFELYFSRERSPRHNLGHFRLSATGDADAVAVAQLRDSLKPAELADLDVAVGTAFAQLDKPQEAAAAWARALDRLKKDEDRRQIIDDFQKHQAALAALAEQRPQDLPLQVALARSLAESGKKALAEHRRTEALADLNQAQQRFARLLADHPRPQWTVLEPTEMETETGAAMQLQEDGSVFVERPDGNDTYTLVFQSELKGITGLRLETLTDSRLPGGGAGWFNTGNFVLSELSLQVASVENPDQPRSIALQNALADFSQEGWSVRGAIDGDASTGWAVTPEFSKDHWAVFETAEPVGDGTATRLTVRLNHQHPDQQHLLGRFRLSVTSDRNVMEATRLRQEIQASGLVDLDTALAGAYAQQEQLDEAAAAFGRALDLAGDRTTVEQIVRTASAHAGLLEKLAELRPADARLYNVLARHFDAQGDQPRALEFLAEARILYEQQLETEPDNSQVAQDLADLLLDVNSVDWKVLKPVEMTSEGGATFTLQDDGSMLVSGPNVSGDVYTISAVSDLEVVQAVRLEALPDETLPNKGPGRHPTGNFQLTAFRVLGPAVDGEPQQAPVAIRNVTASFAYSAPDVDVAGTIDENSNKVWHVWSRVGEEHHADYQLEKPLRVASGDRLTIVLEHKEYGGEGINLGRFRLSVCDDPRIVAVEETRLAASKTTDSWLRLGLAYRGLGDDERALAAFSRALELAADGPAKAAIAREAAATEDLFAELLARTPNDKWLRLGQAKYLVLCQT